MLSKSIEKLLNKQVEVEAQSSQIYLAMASWADTEGLNGVAQFLYQQADEERMHMLKLVQFINERDGHAIIPALDKPQTKWKSIKVVFDQVFEHEVFVTSSISALVEECLKEKDFTTNNFLQWYLTEQLEEEASAKELVDKLAIIGSEGTGLYMFDRDLLKSNSKAANVATNA